jgi:Universal stress protein family
MCERQVAEDTVIGRQLAMGTVLIHPPQSEVTQSHQSPILRAQVATRLPCHLGSTSSAIAAETTARIPADLAAQVLVVDGSPAQALLDRAEPGKHDLIVVGSRDKGDASALILGSVSHAVLHHSRVPVLIVHVPSVEKPTTTG